MKTLESHSRAVGVQDWADLSPALGLSGNVRKGEHGTTVVYADRFIPDDEGKRARGTGE